MTVEAPLWVWMPALATPDCTPATAPWTPLARFPTSDPIDLVVEFPGGELVVDVLVLEGPVVVVVVVDVVVVPVWLDLALSDLSEARFPTGVAWALSWQALVGVP